MSEHHDLFPSNDDTQSVSDRLSAEALIVDVDGFEGPLDLLLTLSRTQKVDLMRISILELAQQYLDFVERAKALRIELAADYLVMAAWLAFLKSRLLLPPDPTDEGPSGEEMAAHLAFQLERLQAMRGLCPEPKLTFPEPATFSIVSTLILDDITYFLFWYFFSVIRYILCSIDYFQFKRLSNLFISSYCKCN